jgi:hypothetical protein
MSLANGEVIQKVSDGTTLNLKKRGLWLVKVTPDLAFEWLTKNCSINRRLRPTHVSYLASEMTQKRWRPDHPDAILFDKDGELTQGQHRMSAVVESGEEVWMRVETGTEPSLYQYLDSGLIRTLDDRVKLMGNAAENRIVVSLVNFFRKKHSPTRSKINKTSPEEAHDIYEQHKKAMDYIASSYRPIRGISKVQVMAAAVEYFEIDAAKCREFMDTLFSVTGEGECQQARVLRDYVLRHLGTNRMLGKSSDKMDLYRNTVSAMKAHAAGRTIARVGESEW